jgi:hypothetical protein
VLFGFNVEVFWVLLGTPSSTWHCDTLGSKIGVHQRSRRKFILNSPKPSKFMNLKKISRIVMKMMMRKLALDSHVTIENLSLNK